MFQYDVFRIKIHQIDILIAGFDKIGKHIQFVVSSIRRRWQNCQIDITVEALPAFSI